MNEYGTSFIWVRDMTRRVLLNTRHIESIQADTCEIIDKDGVIDKAIGVKFWLPMAFDSELGHYIFEPHPNGRSVSERLTALSLVLGLAEAYDLPLPEVVETFKDKGVLVRGS